MYVPPGAVWLGKTTPLASQATDTPVLVFGPGYRYLFVYHYIAGYSSGGGIALIRLGTGTTVDTGTNYSSMTSHFVAGGATVGTSTSRVSQTGLQVANDSVTTGRRGTHMIWNPEGDPKYAEGITNTYSGTPSGATVTHTSLSVTGGNWWNNTQAQCVAMNGGGVSLLTGSYIDVYGLPG